jgi:hypothetical protein
LLTCIVLVPDIGVELNVGGRKVTPEPFPDEPFALFQFVIASCIACLSCEVKLGSILTCTCAPCGQVHAFGLGGFGWPGTLQLVCRIGVCGQKNRYKLSTTARQMV